jgi:hypothetical protein
VDWLRRTKPGLSNVPPTSSEGTAAMRLLRENGYFFIGGTVATAILIAVVVELLFRYG